MWLKNIIGVMLGAFILMLISIAQKIFLGIDLTVISLVTPTPVVSVLGVIFISLFTRVNTLVQDQNIKLQKQLNNKSEELIYA